jgi:antitoxin HigA-1
LIWSNPIYAQATIQRIDGKRNGKLIFHKTADGKRDKNMVKNGLPAIHPGEFLAEILREMGLSQAEFARTIGVSPMRISYVIKGDRPVTAELALLFGRAFNQSPQYWLNLQASYDLKIAKASIGKRLAGIPALAHA